MATEDRSKYLLIGGFALAVGVALAVYQESNAEDDTLACSLSAAGVGTLTTALSRGRAADEVIRIGGSVLAAPACKVVVDELVDGSSADLVVEGVDGTTHETVTRDELLAPPPAQAPPRWLDGLGHQSAFLYDLCVDGVVGSP
jgi:hypothetical protein